MAMLRLTTLLLLGVCCAQAQAREPRQEDVDVYLLGGQSNMQGIGKLAKLTSEGKEPFSNVFYWNGQAFEVFVPGKTKTSGRAGDFGPELGFARAMSRHGRPLYLIKHFASGMPLHHGWNGNKWVGGDPKPKQRNFYPGRRPGDPNAGTLYTAMSRRFVTAIEKLRESGHAPRIRGFLWMQGEQDCKQETSAREYAASLFRLRARLQQDLQVYDLAFAFGRVLPGEDTPSRFGFRKELHAEMSAADMASGKPQAMFRTRCVETKGMHLLSDRVHFSARGQLALGRAFAAAMLEAQSSGVEVEMWTGPVPGFPEDYKHGHPVWLSAEAISEVSRAELRHFPARVPAKNQASVLIFPGGGYRRLAVRKEGDRVAAFLAGQGYTCFTLRYRVSREDSPPFRFPGPLLDARQAIRVIRSKASDFGIHPEKIGVLGFSAGGHLAAMCATRYADEFRGEAKARVSLRPAFAALIYPVVTMVGPTTHEGSRRALFGKTPLQPDLIAASPEKRISIRTPPLFLVHNQFDKVTSLATLDLARAATQAKVPCELHLYPTNQHGFGIGRLGELPTDNPAITWPSLFLPFLARQ